MSRSAVLMAKSHKLAISFNADMQGQGTLITDKDEIYLPNI